MENDSSETPLLASETEEERLSTTSENALEVISSRETINSRPLRRTLSLFISPLVDDTGSGWGVVAGLCTLTVLGSILGLALPKNEALPTEWSRIASSAVGYTYFLCWSVSFYPQVVSNQKRRSTHGLSVDFCALNVIGFGCYSIYNLLMFYSPTIQDLYRHRHGDHAEITVQSNDVAFAIHAFVLSSVTLCQIGYYGGLRALGPSRVIRNVMFGIVAVCFIYGLLVAVKVNGWNWLDFLYLLSFVKIFISLIKYIPQVLLNCRRKSTIGWSIWNIILDFTGGILSDLQLVGDCASLQDWTGITGNLAKFGLGFVSVSFDLIFMLQHYVLYRHGNNALSIAPVVDSKSDEAIV